jgi:predicted aspartyl protease
VGLATITAFGVCAAVAAPATVPHAAGNPAGYRIKLERFVVAPNHIAGLLVKVRINGGPPLKLLVDSGSQSVVLARAAALHSHCAGGVDFELVGAGAATATRAKQQTADTLELGDLTLRGVPLIVADRTLGEGIQGVLPLSIFSEFLVRLDFPAKELDLLPYPNDPADRSVSFPVLSSNQLLFANGTVNEAYEGHFLLDTGSAFSAISRDLANQLHISESLAARVPLRGGIADMNAPLLSGLIRLRLASRLPVTGPVVAVDLSTASRYHGFEISGLIGYSALCDSVLTVSYRDSVVRIGSK